MVMGLGGDLGSGKTAFVQGLARGLGVPETYYITSPTYTLVNAYPGRCPLFHVDLYRIKGEEDLEDIGFQELMDDTSIVAVEWFERARGTFPGDHLEIHLEACDEDSRVILVKGYGLQSEDLIRSLASITRGGPGKP
jgi:tRNA threonylcarbamoyladenosine biosynthesis protein TsaE